MLLELQCYSLPKKLYKYVSLETFTYRIPHGSTTPIAIFFLNHTSISLQLLFLSILSLVAQYVATYISIKVYQDRLVAQVGVMRNTAETQKWLNLICAPTKYHHHRVFSSASTRTGLRVCQMLTSLQFLGMYAQDASSKQSSAYLQPHSQASPVFCSSVCIQYNTRRRALLLPCYTEHKPKNKKRGRPGNEASLPVHQCSV